MRGRYCLFLHTSLAGLRRADSPRHAHRRLTSVVIECLPYQEMIARYDSTETLFYLDPPYWGCENDYGKGIFSRSDFESLSDQLDTISGRFILSINDTPEVRKIFRKFELSPVQLNYQISGKATPAKELIISNG